MDMADVPTKREPGGRKGNQGLALHGVVSGRARGPIKAEPLVGIRRREVPAVTEAEVTVEVAETVISARIRRMTMMRKM